MFKENTKNFKVLTPDGYKSFRGVQKINKEACEVVCKTGESLKCSLKHPLCIDVFNFKFKTAEELVKGDKIFHEDGWKEVYTKKSIGKIDLYDLIDVDDTVSYYTNGFLSHNCEFINFGDSSIDDDLYDLLSGGIIEPEIVLNDGCYKIWEEPNPDHIYAVGVDTAEGVGKDASCVQVLDITDPRDIRQVAMYYNNKISPPEFTKDVYKILENYGKPLALIERNNCGAQVVDRIFHDIGYEKIVNYGAAAAHRKKIKPGMIAHTNTKHKGVVNMRYWVNDLRAVTIRDQSTLDEMRNFVRYPNGTWKAKSNHHDDTIMALLYALFVLDKDIAPSYFDVIEEDDTGRPLTIEAQDFGVSLFEDSTSIYLDNEIMGVSNANIAPIYFGMDMDEQKSEIEEMYDDGWELLR